ncbi:MAG: hypothetical protein KDA96_11695, partial [Planctomycetaceae bacterium]|nr:hypothetical protein [Planctomycetaceae bacterium]
MRTSRIFLLLMSALILAGCIVGDRVTTFTINPDGSAELMIWQSNLHSTQTGEAAVRELADFRTSFAAQTSDEFEKVRNAGGTIVSATLLREQAPFSCVIRARLDDVSAIGRYFAADDTQDGVQIKSAFVADGNRRTLTIQVVVPDQLRKGFTAQDLTLQERRQAVADG